MIKTPGARPRVSFANPAARSALLCSLLAVVLAGCSLGPDRPDPTPLTALTPTLTTTQAWSHRIGDVSFPLAVAVVKNTFTVADDSGKLSAYQADTGAELWRADVNAAIAAGVGSDGRFSAVVSRDNQLITLDAGKVTWRKKLPSRVVTAPLVAGERVFVVAVDRTVHAFDAIDGRKLWTFQKPGDALTLAQPSVLIPYRDTLVVGQGGKLSGLDPLQGTVRWDATITSPRGTNEVERLADLVGPASRNGDLICARAFQAAVGCVNADRGSLAWTRNATGTNGLAGDARTVVGADGNSRIGAWRTADGAVAWTLDAMLYRGLSAPGATGVAVVFGDKEGFVHWFDREKGTALSRMPTDGNAIRVTPVRDGAVTLVVTEEGGLFAFRSE